MGLKVRFYGMVPKQKKEDFDKFNVKVNRSKKNVWDCGNDLKYQD